ncbi:hypothetical protein J437_LFUL007299 [Ladona fulva]|uniref:Bee-milk protein n=1 Tax=Ladona fulva TaxID=123851 RepID=A0A8K0KRZ0_LADFU|nr:hypothetical protein J437_LFUL007299 [Ladona fulva]
MMLVNIGILLASALTFMHLAEAQEEVTWEGAYFDWPCNTIKKLFERNGKYNSRNVIATRFGIVKDQGILALPRFHPGNPVTLGKISLKNSACDPIIKPFPCWSFQEEGDCAALQNVVDIYVDVNEIVWALDIGVVNTLEEQPIRHCSPKVVGICSKSGKVFKSIDLANLVCPDSRLQYVVADVAEDGRTYLYISDAATRSLIVYDVHGSRGLRVLLPKAVTSGCGGNRDVLYLALVHKPGGKSVLYLTYLCSAHLFSIRTDYLRKGASNGRLVSHGLKPDKIIPLGTDGGEAIFFRYEGHNDVYRWDTNTCFSEESFEQVSADDSCLLATQIVPDYRKGRMRLLSSNFHDYLQGTIGCGAIQRISTVEGVPQ